MTTDSGMLYTQDPAVRAVVATVTEQVDTMNRGAQNVETIAGDIEAAFKSLAATQFISKMGDWVQEYGRITQSYNNFQQTFQTGHEGIDSAHQESLSIAGSWMSGDHVYNALNP